jgi:hypothetical protein
MIKLQDSAFSHIKSVDEKLVANVCGSFRRGAASSGDIDILVGHPRYTSEVKKKPDYVKQIVTAMEKAGFVTDTLSLGETKFMASGGRGQSAWQVVGGVIVHGKWWEGSRQSSWQVVVVHGKW